jgi:uncharacterized cupredoxin-like copper-binding protein
MIRATIAPVLVLLLLLIMGLPAVAHDAHHFSAGQPGNPKKPARVVKISMQELGKKMLYEPPRIVVHKGEQIRFVLFNDGIENHEFVLATVKKNRAHAKEMKKNPHMAHHDPNAVTLSPFNSGELLWKFTKTGTFEYACLIPGHREAGMHGIVVVK